MSDQTAYRGSLTHIVQRGETLSAIAVRFGFRTWQEIYNAPENIAFRRKRPNPNLILPGDELVIPGRSNELPPVPSPPDPIPPEPTPPNPKPENLADARKRLSSYLAREARRDVVDVLLKHPANLIVFGERHWTGDPFKDFFLSELVRRVKVRKPTNTHFHASERFANDTVTKSRIDEYLSASPERLFGLMIKLPPDLLRFKVTLSQANHFPGSRYGVIPIAAAGVDKKSENVRHEGLFKGFQDGSAQCGHVPAGSINSTTSRGNILLGARHAMRRHREGLATDTTCGRLIKAGWAVHVVRLTVRLNFAEGVLYPEQLKLKLIGGSDVLDVLSVVADVAGGRAFWADLTKPDSPFAHLQDSDTGAASIPFNQLFDAIVHLPAETTPFPV